MDKENLIRAVADVREAWEVAIAALGADGLEQQGASGDWRVRDLLAIFNGWDRWNLVQLRCAFTGETPADDELTGGIAYPAIEAFDIDTLNALYVSSTQALPTGEILRHWREISEMRMDWVSGASQAMLDAVVGADWGSQSARLMRVKSEVPTIDNPMPAWRLIFDQVDLQQHHLQTVRDWMDRGKESP